MLRESMRVSGFGSKAFTRKVVSACGASPTDGTRFPGGGTVCVSGYSMHRDESIYSGPHQFRYDRFVAPKEDGVDDAVETLKAASTTETTSSVCGHGKHACPGRQFAIELIKMVVACLVVNHEIESLPERAENVWIGDTPTPLRNATDSVRRRTYSSCIQGIRE